MSRQAPRPHATRSPHSSRLCRSRSAEWGARGKRKQRDRHRRAHWPLLVGILAILTNTKDAQAANSCQFVSITPVVFSPYDVFSATSNDIDGAVTYKCTVPTSISISIDGGLNGTIASRAMTRMGGGTTPLAYQLYRDAARLLPWGNTALTWLTIATASTTDKTVAIFGRIPALQDVQTGSYTDTVTITIDF